MINVLDKETIYRIFYIYLFYTQESKVDTGLPAFLHSYLHSMHLYLLKSPQDWISSEKELLIIIHLLLFSTFQCFSLSSKNSNLISYCSFFLHCLGRAGFKAELHLWKNRSWPYPGSDSDPNEINGKLSIKCNWAWNRFLYRAMLVFEVLWGLGVVSFCFLISNAIHLVQTVYSNTQTIPQLYFIVFSKKCSI